jgi:hypothetical protein
MLHKAGSPQHSWRLHDQKLLVARRASILPLSPSSIPARLPCLQSNPMDNNILGNLATIMKVRRQ